MQSFHVDDVFFVEKRLKEISKDYFVLYNKKKMKWEVHNSSQHFSTLCLTIPYEVLDERTVTLVNKTRIENKEKIIKEIDETNLKLEKRKEKESLEKAKAILEEII
ncbi:MAG: hypothetical protein WCR30_02925 [Clostridia bacterium]